MWLWIKYGADAPLPPMTQALVTELGGVPDAIKYRNLVGRFPRIKRGPDEDVVSHYERLKKNDELFRQKSDPDAGQKPAARRPDTPFALDDPNPDIATPDWLRRHQEEMQAADQRPWDEDVPSRSGDMGYEVEVGTPQRNWNPVLPSEDDPRAIERGPSDLPSRLPKRTPALPQRYPGQYAPVGREGPNIPTMDEWRADMISRGLDPDGVGSARPEDMPAQPSSGWRDLVNPAESDPEIPSSTHGEDVLDALLKHHHDTSYTLGPSWRRRLFGPKVRTGSAASEYIDELLKTANYHDQMLSGDDPWKFHGNYPGEMGSYYSKRIGDRNHVIVKDDGWIHNSGPADAEPDEYGDPVVDRTPIGFRTVGEAKVHAERGTTNVGFRPPPVHQQSLSAFTWRDEE